MGGEPQPQVRQAVAELFEASVTASVLDYNLGRALEGAGEYEAAADAYEQYLRRAGDIRDRPRITSHVQDLRDRAKERRVAASLSAELETTRKEERRSARHRRLVAAAVLSGVGGAILLTGVGLGAGAYARNNEAGSASSQRDALALRGEAEHLQLAANVTMPIGGAIALAGAIWAIVEARRH
jgi:hypothetical protein